MACHADSAEADLLHEVERLTGEEYGKAEIAERPYFKSPSAFSSRLVRVWQHTGQPIPAFRCYSKSPSKNRPVGAVQVRPRRWGGSFGVNVCRILRGGSARNGATGCP